MPTQAQWSESQRARNRPIDISSAQSNAAAEIDFLVVPGRRVNIRLVGPGGAGKSTIGARLAERLQVPFLDLDRHFAARSGDISAYISRHEYDDYARANIETYRSIVSENGRPGVVALSSGFMTYARGVHPDYARIRGDLERHPGTFVLLPSFVRDVCVAETVRRQIARPFGRSSAQEEAVIRERFDLYTASPVQKVETMRLVDEVVDEIVAANRTITAQGADFAKLGQPEGLSSRICAMASRRRILLVGRLCAT